MRDAIRKTNKDQLQYKECNFFYRHKKWGWDGSIGINLKEEDIAEFGSDKKLIVTKNLFHNFFIGCYH